MIHYAIQVLLFQMLFLAVYDLFLKKETFFQWNRAYLISTSILAYAIPFIKINSVSNYVKDDLDFNMPTILTNNNANNFDKTAISNIESSFQLSTIEIIYLIGILLTTLLFFYKISQIYKKITQNKIIKNKDYNLVILRKQTTAFSFFSYLFLGKSIYIKEHQHIIDHELIHIKQKHSLDLLFFEILKIIFWINPFSYLFQHRIATLHEYIADSKAIKEHPKQQFFENLLNQTFQIEKFTFVNQFYKKSLIKKRIIMATKNKSKEILKLKYLLLLPLLFTMLIYSSSSAQNNNEDILITSNGDTNAITIKQDDKNVFVKNKKIDALNTFIEDVPFSIVEEVPVYPGCENSSNKQKCFTEKITKHIDENFNIDFAESLGLSPGKKRIYTRFRIDTNGNIANIKVRSPHPGLQDEAVRIIKLLPKMKAGRQKDNVVNVLYDLPIVFDIKGITNNASRIKGTINNRFGYSYLSKKIITTSSIGVLKNGNNYKAISFSLKLDNEKDINISGNKLNKKAINLINKLELGSRVKIYNIKAIDKNGTIINTIDPVDVILKNNKNTGHIFGQSKNIILSKNKLEDLVVSSLDGNNFYEAISFKVKIPKKPGYLVTGNKLDQKIITNIINSEKNDEILIYDIKIEGTNKETSYISFKLK